MDWLIRFRPMVEGDLLGGFAWGFVNGRISDIWFSE